MWFGLNYDEVRPLTSPTYQGVGEGHDNTWKVAGERQTFEPDRGQRGQNYANRDNTYNKNLKIYSA